LRQNTVTFTEKQKYMSSGIYVTVKLDPFYQQYLRGLYNCFDEIFCFPRASRREYLLYSIIPLLWYPPKDFRLPDCDKESFKISLPINDSKNVLAMNYISERGIMTFIGIIKDFYYARWYEFCDQRFFCGWGPYDIVDDFIEKYKIDPGYRERLLKDFTRFKNYYYQKIYRKKVKSKCFKSA
jgi:hypothetical protein